MYFQCASPLEEKDLYVYFWTSRYIFIQYPP